MYRLNKLPYKKEYNSTQIYKYLSNANFCIGELKGLLDSTPNLSIILKLLNMFEAKESSNIADIKSNFKSILLDSIVQRKSDQNSIQVVNQMRATRILYRDLISKNKIVVSDIHRIQELISPDEAGLRTVKGHKVYNKVTNQVLHIPPQNKHAIEDYFQNLIDYINKMESTYDPLIKMAITHYQFECIHPYKDGNGRVGRIINVMSLIHCGRLNYPILNLSKYMNETKEEYFALLEKCHNNIIYLDEFIIYILKGIYETSNYTTNFIHQINRIIKNTKKDLQKKEPKIFSNKLIEHLFKYPYTKNEIFRNDLSLSRSTTTKYLKLLVQHGFLKSEKYGKEVIYVNTQLVNLFQMES